MALEYPRGFPEHLKNDFDGVLAAAECDFLERKRTAVRGYGSEWLERLIHAYILQAFAGVAHLCCQAGRERLWNGHKIRSEVDGLVDQLTVAAFFDKYPDTGGSQLQSFQYGFRAVLKSSKEWEQFHKELASIFTNEKPDQERGGPDSLPKNVDQKPALGRRPPKRKPDVKTSSERLLLLDQIERELVIINKTVNAHAPSTLGALKRRHPKFQLWDLDLPDIDLNGLLDGETKPKAFAATLVLSHYRITSRRTLYKDRKKIKDAGLLRQ